MRFRILRNHPSGEGILTSPVTVRDHIQGLSNAPLTLVEYGDFECPACGEAYPIVKALQKALQGQLCFVFRHFPLTNIHPCAEHAAEASEASGEQGHFWEMHDVLYENQEALEDEDLAQYVAALGLDARRVIQEILEEVYAPRIREDFMSGARSGVNGTPTFFMNGFRYDGPWDVETMLAALEEVARPADSRFL